MRFQRQLILDHNPAEGRYGDCYRTCVAILLGLDAVEVPHFVEYSILDGKVRVDGGEDTNTTLTLTRKWLRERGLTMLSATFHEDAPAKCLSDWTGGLPFILTVRGGFRNSSHALIGQVIDGQLCGIWCPTVGAPRSNFEPFTCLETGRKFFTAEMIVGIPESLL